MAAPPSVSEELQKAGLNEELVVKIAASPLNDWGLLKEVAQEDDAVLWEFVDLHGNDRVELKAAIHKVFTILERKAKLQSKFRMQVLAGHLDMEWKVDRGEEAGNQFCVEVKEPPSESVARKAATRS